MGCSFDKEILHRYIDNTIEPLEAIFLREHIKYCRECKKELNALMLVDDSLYDYFKQDFMSEKLEMVAEKVIDKCIQNKYSKHSLLDNMNRSITMNKKIVCSSLNFISYIPGVKAIGRGTKAALRMIDNGTKTLVKNSYKKAFNKILEQV